MKQTTLSAISCAVSLSVLWVGGWVVSRGPPRCFEGGQGGGGVRGGVRRESKWESETNLTVEAMRYGSVTLLSHRRLYCVCKAAGWLY